MNDLATEARVRLDVPAETYHVRELGVITTGALKQAMKTPAHYRAWVDAPDEDHPAMAFGRAVHAAVLEWDRFVAEWVVEPKWGDRRFKAEKARYQAWKEASAGKEVITEDDFAAIYGINKSLREHPIVGRLLSAEHVTEATIEWVDEETGLLCKCRPDWWARNGLSLMCDVKTAKAADSRRFSYACRDWGYDIQAAHYTAGAAAVGQPCDFIFAAVEKEPPYAVAVYQIDEAALDEAREMRRETMLRIADCMESGEWPGYPTDIQTLYLPRRNR